MDETRHLHLALRLVAALRHMTAEDIAARAGMDKGQVSKYLRKQVNLKINTLTKLLRALDVSYPDFVAVMAQLDEVDAQAGLPLFDDAEGPEIAEALGLPPEIAWLADEVKRLNRHMQRVVSKLTYTYRPPSSYVTDR
jgi:transcriptional regulator with XRE-family HTH domain